MALDLDPVLMTIGRGTLGDGGGRLTWSQTDLREPYWADRLASAGQPFDAVVSLATLHHFTAGELAAIYQALARLIRPGGLLLNAEMLAAGPPTSTAGPQVFDEARRRGSPPPMAGGRRSGPIRLSPRPSPNGSASATGCEAPDGTARRRRTAGRYDGPASPRRPSPGATWTRRWSSGCADRVALPRDVRSGAVLTPGTSTRPSTLTLVP